MLDVRKIREKIICINDKIVALRRRIEAESGVAYTSQDARHVALDGIQQDLLACGMLILCMGYCPERERIPFLRQMGSALAREETEDLMLKYLRLSLVDFVYFKIDNLFTNILGHFGKRQKKRGFWQVSNAVLERASIPQNGYEKNVLNALAYIRNSMHGNGIHNGDDLHVKLCELDFDFKRGQPVRCASWEHILAVVSCAIDVLKEILLSDAIKGVEDEIEDTFARGMQGSET